MRDDRLVLLNPDDEHLLQDVRGNHPGRQQIKNVVASLFSEREKRIDSLEDSSGERGALHEPMYALRALDQGHGTSVVKNAT